GFIFRAAGSQNSTDLQLVRSYCHRVSDVQVGSGGKTASRQRVSAVIGRPGAQNLPELVHAANTCDKVLVVTLQRLGKICADQVGHQITIVGLKRLLCGNEWRKAKNIVSPEDAFHPGQIRLENESPLTRGLQIYTTDAHVETVFFRS